MTAKTDEKTERGASPLGLETLWLFYRLFGLRVLHFFAKSVGFCVWLFSGDVRRRSPRLAKVFHFTCSLADKLVVMAQGRQLPRVVVRPSADAEEFLKAVAARKGVFILSSHIGTIEVLAALKGCTTTFHAWMEFDRTGVFNAFYMRHAKRDRVVIHPISKFGPETVFLAGDALDRGECLVMAGDRGFGRMMSVAFGASTIELPVGAFRFARALEHPVYFVACIAKGGINYEVIIKRLSTETLDALVSGYAAILRELTEQYPDQVFQWN